ncbi:MAG TPA: isoprenyl transferase [Blastocatellia bacterium]|nr:isoprenyl transferase [Blastocatellia bacterium]
MSDLVKNFEGLIKKGSREEQLLRQIDPERLPRHVAIIMDGNGRWALRRHQPRIMGHRAGAESARIVVEAAARLEIPILTLYAFSTENWKRPADEVEALMTLLREFLRKELDTLKKNGIRLRVIGRMEGLDAEIQQNLRQAMRETEANRRLLLNVALNYSGRAEIVDAVRLLCRDCLEKRIDPQAITEDTFSRYLYTADVPDPDLLIRTSGEMRLSNFLLWQIAYTELYLTETLWPDFRRAHFFSAIIEYQKRERRYGGVGSFSPR